VDITADILWNKVLEHLQIHLSRPTFEAWIKTTVAEELTSERLTIRTSHLFARNWLAKYYWKQLNEVVAEILGYPVEILILTASHGDLPESIPVSPEVFEAANTLVSAPEAPIASPPKNLTLNPKYTFSRFVVGATNRMPHAAALAVAEAPGREFNPLFLCGGVGLGKTHLMQAIAHYRLEISPETRISYVSTEHFTNDLVTAIRKDSMQSFREQYRDIDMLLVDDIQFIEGKEYTQEEFFHTFNSLYESGKQIILASDRPPGQIPRLQDRLCSRFSMGLIADIQVPDLETRMAILQKKAEYENLKIPSEVIQYIAASYTSNIRELEGALVRTVAYISISGLPMNVANVAPILNPPKQPIVVSVESILNVVSEHFNIDLADLQSNSRRREISQARQIAMYLARQHTELSLPKIGEALGGKDHTTVMYSCDKVTQLQAVDADLSQTLRLLSDRIYLLAQTSKSSKAS
jgi:chromosomal replication initiator protein